MEKSPNSSGNRRSKAVQLDLRTSNNGHKGDPIWVTIRNECLQNYCYACGRIGHDEKNCKSQNEDPDEEDAEIRYGSGLGTTHVKTMDEVVVLHDYTWDEVQLFQGKPPPSTREDHRRKALGGSTVNGNTEDHGGKSANSSLWREEPFNGLMNVNCEIPAQVQREIRITEITALKEPTTEDPESPPKVMPFQQSLAGGIIPIIINEPLPPDSSTPISPKSPPPNKDQSYRVESPGTATDVYSAIIPFPGLSPLSAVTTSLNRINLKRSLDFLDEDTTLPLSKKRLTYQDPEPISNSNEVIWQFTDGPH
ncbi:hypothetical protein K1719_019975 [Acacia pycnantha]|nr:hypothetical protein K1719_019975 [Acacia pycnantha]